LSALPLKLKHYAFIYDIRNSVPLWIHLSNHTQQIICGGCCSRSGNVVSGVPQCSVLVPLLFLYFDIPNYIMHFSTCHVDDSNFYNVCGRIDSPADTFTLQNDLSMLEEWERWEMLNIDKCMVLTRGIWKSRLLRYHKTYQDYRVIAWACHCTKTYIFHFLINSV